MKYSIIIVAYKAFDKLEACIKSIQKHPPKSTYEIIVVDNSRELDLKFNGCTVYFPEKNLGYSGGANYGATYAKGDILIFVNPDTIVSEFWCEEMTKGLEVSDKIGAVGPISNFVAGLQHAGNHMQQYDDYKKNAVMALRGMGGRYLESQMLIGFFLMTPKKIFTELGGFDNDLFLGCDDLDYSLKLSLLGYKMVIATGVYVYHYGHESFKQNPDSERLIKQTENIYIEKLMKMFDGNPPEAVDLWGFDMINTQPVKPVKLSVSMIVKSFSSDLPLLKKLDFVDEIVIVTTQNKSEIIAIGDKIRVYHFRWNDSFADARNYSLSKCTGDWVLWVDDDDKIPEGMGELIRAIIDKPGPLTAKKQCHFGFKIVDHGHGTTFTAEQPRLFPRVEGLKWENRVHENYMKSASELGLTYVLADGVEIEHTGYSDPKVNKQKSDRNIRLLELEEDIGNKFYQLGKEYHSQENYELALDYYEKALELSEGMEADHIKYSIALCHYQWVGVEFWKHDVDDYLFDNNKPDATFLLAEYFYFIDNNEKAKELYTKYLSYGTITDPFGTNQASFRKASEERLKVIG
jgi:GT2 family glycosyltransferase/tetratricopeptide (TPR) repeat protein